MKARLVLWSLATAGSVAVLVGGLAATSAQAVPGSNSVADSLTMVGSDTTQYFDDQFAKDVNANSYGNNPSVSGAQKDTITSVYAFDVAGKGFTQVAPKDSYSVACTWYVSPSVDPSPSTGCPAGVSEAAPNGSGAGNTRLLAAAAGTTASQRAAVDIGRASSDQCTGKGVLTETCYAYARDAVGWAKYRTQSFALTVAQIQSIYNCKITNWSQIPNAGTGTIGRYFPQTGSGTGSFFVSAFLNGQDPRTTSYSACGGVSVPASHLVEENTATSIPSASRTNAIVPFSAGSWIAQVADQPGVEVPNTIGTTGLKIGQVTVGSTTYNPVTGVGTTTPTPTPAAFKEGTTYPGARYVFHDVDSRLTSYSQALHFVGTNTTGPSVLCANSGTTTGEKLAKARIQQYGFYPLTKRSTDPSYWDECRVFVGTNS